MEDFVTILLCHAELIVREADEKIDEKFSPASFSFAKLNWKVMIKMLLLLPRTKQWGNTGERKSEG